MLQCLNALTATVAFVLVATLFNVIVSIQGFYAINYTVLRK